MVEYIQTAQGLLLLLLLLLLLMDYQAQLVAWLQSAAHPLH
jgi:hypothetical protein